MVVNRVKVTFLNEPGEGSGVARAFYTALAEAILVKQKLPNLGPAQVIYSATYGHCHIYRKTDLSGEK